MEFDAWPTNKIRKAASKANKISLAKTNQDVSKTNKRRVATTKNARNNQAAARNANKTISNVARTYV